MAHGPRREERRMRAGPPHPEALSRCPLRPSLVPLALKCRLTQLRAGSRFMVPEGRREEPVARGEEGKPPGGQSIPVSGK